MPLEGFIPLGYQPIRVISTPHGGYPPKHVVYFFGKRKSVGKMGLKSAAYSLIESEPKMPVASVNELAEVISSLASCMNRPRRNLSSQQVPSASNWVSVLGPFEC